MGNAAAGAFATAGAEVHLPAAKLSEDANDVQVAATVVLRIAGVVAYHTSIIVGDREYFFDNRGIESAPPFWSHAVSSSAAAAGLDVEGDGAGHGPDSGERRAAAPPASRLEVCNYGKSALTGAALLKGLAPFFEDGTYDVVLKNCNAFTDAALYLLTRKRLESRFTRMERALAATTPISTGVINTVMRASTSSVGSNSRTRSQQRLEYVSNPLAKDFSVEASGGARHGGWSCERAMPSSCCTRFCAEHPQPPVVLMPVTLDEAILPVPHPSELGHTDTASEFEPVPVVDVGDPSGSANRHSSDGENPDEASPPRQQAQRRGRRRQLPV
mmetsp:Transcript_106408/g.318054  ORF Transcript_106408/g.318054 Transcript_106408/m.318054 type:complete len:329 (+) Transcript_106408:84-1070(+)